MRTPDLTLLCGKCRKPVIGGTGSLSVSHADLAKYRILAAEWEASHGGEAVELSVLLEHPDEVPWETWHYACRDRDDRDRYEISADQIGSWAELARWTAHLMGKSWLDATDWDDVLREAAGEITPRRISGGKVA